MKHLSARTPRTFLLPRCKKCRGRACPAQPCLTTSRAQQAAPLRSGWHSDKPCRYSHTFRKRRFLEGCPRIPARFLGGHSSGCSCSKLWALNFRVRQYGRVGSAKRIPAIRLPPSTGHGVRRYRRDYCDGCRSSTQPPILEEIDDGNWNVCFGPLQLGCLRERHMRIEDEYRRLSRHKV